MPPISSTSLVGRYAVVAVDGKGLPGFVSASVNNPAYGYDSAWMQADTLWLRPDLSAEEVGVFSYKMAGQGVTIPTVGTETTTVRGGYRVSDGRLIVNTWLETDDTIAVLRGGARLQRAVMVWSRRPTRPRPLLTYDRVP
jgi:hypothetical protein